MRIKLNKATNEVIFKCNGKKEMRYVLDIFILGNMKIIKDVRKKIEELD